jgi:hypothetical protein
MFSKVRKFLHTHSPDWLNTEVNKDLLQNLSAKIAHSQTIPSPNISQTKDINVLPSCSLSSQERARERSRGAGGEVNINPETNPSISDRPLMTANCSLFTEKGTPHWRRINQVFQTLDTAPENATYNQLIEYVRLSTGKGCSRKLISKWKKQNTSHKESDHNSDRRYEKSNRAIAPYQIFQSPTKTPSTVSSFQFTEVLNHTTNNNSLSTEKLITDDCSLMTVKAWSYLTAAAGITIALVGCELLPLQLNNNRLTENIAIASVTNPNLNPNNPLISDERQERSKKLEPNNIKIELTLDNPQDLKVKPGDKVSAGQTLSDRTSLRNQLQAKKKQLQLSLQKLNLPLTPIPKPKPIPEIAQLPPVSYDQEEAAIKLKQQKLNEAQQAIANQKEKINQIRQLLSNSTSPPFSRGAEGNREQGSTPNLKLIFSHEQAILKNLEAAQQQAQIQLELAISQLTTAKENRAYAEYQRKLELDRRAIALQQQQQAIASQESERSRLLAGREYSIAQIETQIQEIDYQIEQLSTVKAPYNGTIKKIKWTGQSNNTLTALITLAVNDHRATIANGTGKPTSTTETREEDK